MGRLYSNENFPLPAVNGLRQLGHDVLTMQDIGKANQAVTDEEVLAFAIHENRILLTLNRKHFIVLHKNVPEHKGIIVCSFDRNFIALAKRIHLAIQQNDNFNGKLIKINRPSI